MKVKTPNSPYNVREVFRNLRDDVLREIVGVYTTPQNILLSSSVDQEQKRRAPSENVVFEFIWHAVSFQKKKKKYVQCIYDAYFKIFDTVIEVG